MKKFIILAIAILAFTFSANAQYINHEYAALSSRMKMVQSDETRDAMIDASIMKLEQYSQEYEKACNTIRQGWIAVGVGTGISLVGLLIPTMYYYDSCAASNNTSLILSVLGAAVTTGGSVAVIAGYSKRASICHKKADLVFQLALNGITVTF